MAYAGQKVRAADLDGIEVGQKLTAVESGGFPDPRAGQPVKASEAP